MDSRLTYALVLFVMLSEAKHLALADRLMFNSQLAEWPFRYTRITDLAQNLEFWRLEF